MRVVPYLVAAIAVVAASMYACQTRRDYQHSAVKADRLDRHCELMRITLDAIDQDVDHGGPAAEAATSMFENLAINEFRILRPCVGDQALENCSQDRTPTCVHRGVAAIRTAWAW